MKKIALLLSLGWYGVLAQGNFHLVKDLTPGIDETSLIEMVAVNGYVYLIDADHGLLRTDGTPEGTIVIENQYPLWYWNYTGSYLRVQNWVENNYTIGKTNGEVGALQIVSPEFVNISELKEINGILYFVGDDGVHGPEIWRCDGSTSTMVKDVGNNGSNFSPQDLTAYNGNLFFVADDGTHGAELWKTDGTESGTVMVKDIFINNNNGFPSNFEILNNELYFIANNGLNGQEIWKTDGTESGTIMIKDIAEGKISSGPAMLTRMGDAIYFEAFDNTYGRALWKTSGTAETTTLVKDINPGVNAQSYISNLTEVNGTLYFAADDGIHGKELWKSDGKETSLLKDMTPGSGNESELKNF